MKVAISFLPRKLVSLPGKVFSLFRKLFSSFAKLIQKLWLIPPFSKIGHVLQRPWKGSKPLEYRFLPYVTSVLRALGWAVLVIGVIASILIGLEILRDGLMVGTREVIGVGPGVSVIVLGVVGSFLAWLFLLANRELVYLFIHVKENTRNTAESITNEPN